MTMSYADELEAVIEREQALRRNIALAIAEEAGRTATKLGEADLQAADEAIESWADGDDEQHDLRAFRALTPLQELLAEHRGVLERIHDIQDRRLS